MNNTSTHRFKYQVTLAITGASGTCYALRLLDCLIKSQAEVFLLVSDAASAVAATETGLTLPTEKSALLAWCQSTLQNQPGQVHVYHKSEWTAPVASGSAITRNQMVICPASMGTLSAIAAGASNNLIERAADVILKERKKLILVPRETPYSEIHLENMLKLTRMGVTILPASPGFYYRPTTIAEMVDFIVARILQHLKIPQTLIKAWGENE
ncbi:MAG: UbiX family flavin prenyltransferase [Endozoicomonadaceae bacterium]|nr:UbiX family flavin prenyltransferase [Endozoicomonadaceae bacterium]MCY4329792.1 UbiX family flavin prenyltransferase [Endozoicomonadaceae bacterium]